VKRILQPLRNTDRGIASYVWRATLISLVPSIVIAAVVTIAVPDSEPPGKESPILLVLFGVLFVSPWLETLLMWPVLWILKRLIRNSLGVALVSATLWGCLHSLISPTWGLIVLWPFFVLSLCFLEWQKRSTGRALVVTGLVHTCNNSLPAVAVLLSA
jgi:hypothetical protein